LQERLFVQPPPSRTFGASKLEQRPAAVRGQPDSLKYVGSSVS